jgi:tetratricopeptide (TPR) repeat protein
MASDRGDFERAEALWEESLALAQKLGDARRRAAGLGNMGLAEVVRGDFEGAEALFTEQLALGRELKAPFFIASASLNLGVVATRRGDLERARTLLEESLVLLGEMGAKAGIAESLESLAGLAGALGDYGRAARLWGAADALRYAIGAPWLPLERRLHEPYLDAIRSRGEKAGWTKAWDEGRAMSVEDAVAYALEEDQAARRRESTGERT